MRWYCEKCKTIHGDDELCPHIKNQLSKYPEWLAELSDFTIVAGMERLITTQSLDQVATGINKLTGSNLSYEGTQQFARDIQVFQRLNTEPFSRSGHFASPETAKAYLENVKTIAENHSRTMTGFECKLTGYSQEVDWLRMKQGQLSSLWEQSSLLGQNAPGVDGITISRFTGEEISRTTVKASINPMTQDSTIIKSVDKSLSKGTATSKDIIFGPEGTVKAAQEAGLKNPVVECNSAEQIRQSNQRLEEKILSGQATTTPTIQQVGSKMMQGAVVGAAVAITISSITTYARFKNGELTREEAFANIGEDSLKGALIGAGMGGITIFLPGGAIGLIGGIAIGVYFNTVCTNILDEVFGKGAYGAILNASGYVYGMTFNLAKYYEKIKQNNNIVSSNLNKAKQIQNEIEKDFDLFDKMKGE